MVKQVKLVEFFLKGEIDEVEDGIVYGAACGLGFGATENILYGLSAGVAVGGLAGLIFIVVVVV